MNMQLFNCVQSEYKANTSMRYTYSVTEAKG